MIKICPAVGKYKSEWFIMHRGLYLCTDGKWKDAGLRNAGYYYKTKEDAQRAILEWEATVP